MPSSTLPVPVGKTSYYTEDVDFAELAKQDAEFATVYNTNGGRIDWQDAKAVQNLTFALLKRDFGLTLTLPDNRLCPPIPVRWNYIRWLQELLDTTSSDDAHTDQPELSRRVLGLDIGVGASCIYSLLACASRPSWHMLGSDVDEHSLDYARRNVDTNNMTPRIRLALTSIEAPFIPLAKMGVDSLDFVMCNPPFYSSEADMHAAYGRKAMPPSAVCTGSTNEMICEGGDVGFVSRIIAESLVLRSKVRWYSAMLGRLASAQQVVAKLKEAGISNFAVTNLKAGQKTRRWAVAWSFADRRPRNDVARHGELVLALLPAATAWTIDVPGMTTAALGDKVDATLKVLDLRWRWRAAVSTGVASAKGNVWSRAARRKRKFEEQDDASGSRATRKEEADSHEEGEEEDVALAMKITCSVSKVDLRWLRGNDAVLFESFCGMLKRALGARTT